MTWKRADRVSMSEIGIDRPLNDVCTVGVWVGDDVVYLDEVQQEFLFNKLLEHYDKVVEAA